MKIPQEEFDPKQYLATYYPEDMRADTDVLLRVSETFEGMDDVSVEDLAREIGISREAAENLIILIFLSSVFQELSKAYPAGSIDVLDVGGGPTIYQHIALSLQAARITHSELSERNLKETLIWVAGEKGAHNWDAYFSLVQTILLRLRGPNPLLANNHEREVNTILTSDSVKLFRQKVRDCLRGHVVKGDIFQPNIGLEDQGQKDVVTSNFAVDSATSDKSEWKKGMKNIMAKVKPGGFLSVTSLRNADWYKAGDKKIPNANIDENDLRAICAEEGFTIKRIKMIHGSDKEVDGYEGMVFLLAQKNPVTAT